MPSRFFATTASRPSGGVSPSVLPAMRTISAPISSGIGGRPVRPPGAEGSPLRPRVCSRAMMASSDPRRASQVFPMLAILAALLPTSCGARTGVLDGPQARVPLPDASMESTDAGPPSDASVCDHPAIPIYACPPLPLSEVSGTCQGGPPAAGDYGADASYPLDCVVTLPSCDPNSGGPSRCTCSLLQMNHFWACGF
jgi:hypothetical protein